MEEVPTKIKGGRGKQTEKKPRVLKSNFLLTISTGQRYKADDPKKDEDAEVFEDSVRDILNHLSEYVNVIGGEGHQWDSNYIRGVDVDYTIEHGPKTGALHAHILFKIQHNTKVQLAYDRIKAKLKEDLGLDNLYMLNKLVRPSSDDWLREYLDKYR